MIHIYNFKDNNSNKIYKQEIYLINLLLIMII